jgi:hypothetical protein
MDDTPGEISKGMEVLSADGVSIGTVARVFSAAPSPSGHAAGAPAAPPSTTTPDVAPAGRETEELAFGAPGAAALPGGFADAPGAGPYSQSGPGMAGNAAIEYAAAEPLSALGLGGEATLTPSDTKYIEVHHGGILGLGGESFYIPFSAVSAVNGSHSLTLTCSRDECAARFAQEPACLDAS